MATLAATPLVLPFDPASLPMEKRCEYLHKLWSADVDPFVFVGIARRLGYGLCCHWDITADMPLLAPDLRILH
ncbi:hypothetical protein KPG66_00545 [Mycetohabitans sp. B2]|jgi:hypothetical protein|uniref:hypothetical protein n=1 Tax=Mycetohabitans sp. B2 TaxID=2841274 RepID=UPI001F42194A|nr:hypothetical protein [Mycetohabitans sp. B2]MCF7694655.1 hypothetical protein [Mycetohabitans sp. B2]